jgi:cathepsin X
VNPEWTPVALSAQEMVNCVDGSDCNGGYAYDVYRYANQHGANHGSCLQYDANNHYDTDPTTKKTTCEAINQCRVCSGAVPATGKDLTKNCVAPTTNTKYYTSKYSEFAGVDKMKAEIFANGPISCAVEATPEFDVYTGGIYSQKIQFPETNHIIAVVGWGTDKTTGEEFWWGRNSWGTYWGENGYFQMKMYADNLAIETDCTSGMPSYTPVVPFEATLE